jgi:hypothetical protein
MALLFVGGVMNLLWIAPQTRAQVSHLAQRVRVQVPPSAPYSVHPQAAPYSAHMKRLIAWDRQSWSLLAAPS